MAEQEMVTATRADVDDAVFGAAEIVADTMDVPRRERLQLTLQIANAVMHNIDLLSDTAKRSEAGRKAAAARYAKPKPGPAIPPPVITGVPCAPQPELPSEVAEREERAAIAAKQVAPLPPPPHPALMPQGTTPFGNPPA